MGTGLGATRRYCPMIILVTGGRKYADVNAVYTTLDAVIGVKPPERVILVQGGAKGADKIAKQWAKDRLVHCAQVDAYWDLLPTMAGTRRNSGMLLLKPDILVAFPGGRGTADMKTKARAAGIQMVVIE